MDIQETAQMGAPAAAAGLSVACRTWDRDGHLLWDTTSAERTCPAPFFSTVTSLTIVSSTFTWMYSPSQALLLAATPDESELLLYACEDGKLVLTVLDPATGEVLQRLDLLEQAVGNWGISVIEGCSRHRHALPVPGQRRVVSEN